MNKDKLLGVASGIIAGLLWGGWLPVSKYAVSGTLYINDVIFLRFFGATLLSIAFLFRYGFYLSRKNILKILSLVFCSGLGYIFICFVGFTYAKASYGLVITVCITFFSIVLSHIFYPEKNIKKMAIGLVLVLIGFGIFIYTVNQQTSASLIGIGLFIFAGFIFATFNLFTKKWQISSIHAVSLISFYSLVLFLPYYIFSEKNLFIGSINEIIFQFVYQGIIMSFIALYLFNFTSVKLGQAKGSLFVIIAPVSGVFFSYLFLSEQITSTVMVAMSLMVFGMFVGLYSRKQKKAN